MKMRLKLLLLISIAGSGLSFAQIDGTLLLGLTNATTTEMNGTTDPVMGSLLYNTSTQQVFQYNGSAWMPIAGAALRVMPKTSSYTVTEDDNGAVLTFNSNTDLTLSLPTGLPVGFNISVYQLGTGKVILSGMAGATLLNRLSRFKTAGQNAAVGIVCTATNTYHATGDLKK